MSNSTINQPLSCILAIVLFSISMEYAKVSPSCPELICVSHCCCFFLFLPVPPASPEQAFYTNWLCIFSLFNSCVVCLIVSFLCLCRPPLLSWPPTQTDSVVSLCSFLMFFISVSVPTCPELVCECDPMLWLLSSRRTLSNVGILPFDLHTYDVEIEPFVALHGHW